MKAWSNGILFWSCSKILLVFPLESCLVAGVWWLIVLSISVNVSTRLVSTLLAKLQASYIGESLKFV